jgi:TetR/AcrR family transcriptional regulator, regulator of mycofactocin system
MNLLATVPTLQADATLHYDAWERAISAFVAARTGDSPDTLWPVVVGRTTLAACRAAYDRWSACVDGDLTRYLDAALVALAAGFDPERLPASPETVPRP